jgi:cullin 1
MKARKTMKNQPLIQEVISQISQRFTPKIPDIKKVCFPLALAAEWSE